MRTGLLAVCLWAGLAAAHDARPIYAQIDEAMTGVFDVQWNTPLSMAPRALPRLVFPEQCKAGNAPVVQRAGGSFVARQQYICRDSLSGHQLQIHFPGVNPSLSTLFRVSLNSGEEYVRVLQPGEFEWTVPAAESGLGVAVEYAKLGISHIWNGVDHLLFVACLLFVAATPRRFLVTLTGFTLAHSLTLVVSALQLVRVPVPPVEAVIALSVVFLAWEIVRGDQQSLTFRRPIGVSISFGLLHGFGFAAVLHDIGLPQTQLPVALLFFNVGVEVGQVLFVLGLLIGYRLLGALIGRVLGPGQHAWIAMRMLVPSKKNMVPQLTLVAGYLIGGVASYWMIERVVGFWI